MKPNSHAGLQREYNIKFLWVKRRKYQLTATQVDKEKGATDYV